MLTITYKLRACLVHFFLSLNFHNSSPITQFLSLITLNTKVVWYHHSVSITHYFSHYLGGPRLSWCSFFFFFFFSFFLHWVRSSSLGFFFFPFFFTGSVFFTRFLFFFFFFTGFGFLGIEKRKKKEKKKKLHHDRRGAPK